MELVGHKNEVKRTLGAVRDTAPKTVYSRCVYVPLGYIGLSGHVTMWTMSKQGCPSSPPLPLPSPPATAGKSAQMNHTIDNKCTSFLPVGFYHFVCDMKEIHHVLRTACFHYMCFITFRRYSDRPVEGAISSSDRHLSFSFIHYKA